MSDFSADDMSDLEVKKRARRRLVGATVLALLAVIVLPLAVENSEEPHTVPDMQVSIPERGEFELPQRVPEDNAESASVDIEPDAASDAPDFPVEIPPPPEPPLSPPAPPPSVQSMPKPTPAPPAAQPSKEPRQERPPSRPATAEKEAEAARALALLNGNLPAKKTGGKEGSAQDQVFIQVGAFNKADRAARQAEELKKQGFDAYAEKTGKVTRVRIGPLPQSEGEQIVARLKAQGRNAVLSSR
ncbi:MAG: SPOR domain-containing protein [Betaproteobacteria bacterium]|nr:SPOR domain-containing protein [Betaproteobacteria bacterium]